LDSSFFFVKDLVSELSSAFHGGVSDAAQALHYFVKELFSSMEPEFASMGTNMVTSYIMNTFANVTNNQTVVTSPLPVPSPTPSVVNIKKENTRFEDITSHPSSWASTIRKDEITQSTSSPQKPYSDAYLSGIPPAKRSRGPGRSANTTTPQNLVQDRIKESAQKSGAKPKSKESKGGK